MNLLQVTWGHINMTECTAFGCVFGQLPSGPRNFVYISDEA